MADRTASTGSVEGRDPLAQETWFNPWRYIGQEHPEWIVELGDLAGMSEAMCVKDRIILLERTRTKWERRCDLAHAIAHIELGHRDRCSKSDERAATRRQAKMCIALEALGEALHRTAGLVDDECADLLGVDVETLTVRLQVLHPAERGYLRRRLAHLSDGSAA